MALIQCPECRKEISNRAGACPNCGCPIAELPRTAGNTVGNVGLGLDESAITEAKKTSTTMFVLFIVCLLGKLVYGVALATNARVLLDYRRGLTFWDGFGWLLSLSDLAGTYWSVVFLLRPRKWSTITRLQTRHKPFALIGGLGLMVLLLFDVLVGGLAALSISRHS